MPDFERGATSLPACQLGYDIRLHSTQFVFDPMKRYCRAVTLASGTLLLACFAMTTGVRGQEASLPLNRGDTVCVIGNTLAERMQHIESFRC